MIFIKKYSQDQIDAFHICENIDECLKSLYWNENEYEWAIGASRLNIVNSPFYSSSKFFCFDQTQHIGNYFVSLKMQMHFENKSEVNKIIRYLTEGGFFIKWHRENIRRRISENPFTDSQFITMDQLWFWVVIVGIGWFLSILTFYLEILVHKKLRDENGQQWLWINLEHVCDGYRHRFRNLTNRS